MGGWVERGLADECVWVWKVLGLIESDGNLNRGKIIIRAAQNGGEYITKEKH